MTRGAAVIAKCLRVTVNTSQSQSWWSPLPAWFELSGSQTCLKFFTRVPGKSVSRTAIWTASAFGTTVKQTCTTVTTAKTRFTWLRQTCASPCISVSKSTPLSKIFGRVRCQWSSSQLVTTRRTGASLENEWEERLPDVRLRGALLTLRMRLSLAKKSAWVSGFGMRRPWSHLTQPCLSMTSWCICLKMSLKLLGRKAGKVNSS